MKDFYQLFKKLRLTLVVIVLFCTTFSAQAQQIHNINSWQDLVDLRELTATGTLNPLDEYNLMGNLEPPADAYGDADGWIPIGNATNPFTATFNGQGFYIAGLWINRPGSDNQGLFGVLDGATVKNLTVIIGLYCEYSYIWGCVNVGGVAGMITNNSVVDNCMVTGGNVIGSAKAAAVVGISDATSSLLNSYAYICKIEVTGAGPGDDGSGDIGRVISNSALGNLDGNIAYKDMLLVQNGVVIGATEETSDGKDGTPVPLLGCGCPDCDPSDPNTPNTLCENPPAITVTYDPADRRVTCDPYSHVTVTLTAYGGATPYIFNWTAGFPDPVLSAGNVSVAYFNKDGKYIVSITDATGCEVEAEIEILPPIPIDEDDIHIDAPVTHIDCHTDPSGIVIAVVDGDPEWTYEWKIDNVLAGTGSSITITAGMTDETSTLSVEVKGPNDCVTTKSLTITKDVTIPTISIDQGGFVIGCGFTGLQLTTTQTCHGSCVVTWSPAAIVNGYIPADFAGGTITAAIEDIVNGCLGQPSSIEVTVNTDMPAAVANASKTSLGCGDDTFNLLQGAGTTCPSTTTCTYEWWDGDVQLSSVTNIPATSITNGSSKTYTLKVIGANGCVATDDITISRDVTPPTVSIAADPSTVIGCTGTITLTATGACAGTCSYVWSNGATGATITLNQESSAGDYSVTVTDSENNCTAASNVITITKNIPTITVTLGATYELPCDPNYVTITATVTGGGTPNYFYSWNGATAVENQNTFNATTTGTVTVSVTDANGCTSNEATTTITQGVGPVVTLNVPATVINCINQTSGITLTVTGCNDCSYLWNHNGAMTPSITVNSPREEYSVLVTGANGCTTTLSTAITQDITPPSNAITPTDGVLSCANRTVTLTAGGACDGCTYLWSDGSAGSTLAVTTAGTYSVIVTGANGCSDPIPVPVTVTGSIASLDISIDPANVTIDCSNANSTFYFTPAGCTGTCTYSWGAGSSSTETPIPISSADLLAAGGSLTITATDENQCTGTATVTVTDSRTTPAVNITPTSGTITCTNTGVTLTMNPTSCTDCDIIWYIDGVRYTSGDGLTQISITEANIVDPATSISVSVTIIDPANSCQATATPVTITKNVTPPSSAITPTSGNITCTNTTVALTADCTDCTYSWTGPNDFTSSNRSINASVGGTYYVTVTGANGCPGDAQGSAQVNDIRTSPTISIDQPDFTIDCNTTTATTLTTTVTNCAGCNYLWSTGDNTSSTQIPANFAGGTVSVTITDPNNGCSDTDQITVTVNRTSPTAVASASKTTLGCGDTTFDLVIDPGTTCPTAAAPCTYEWWDGATQLTTTTGLPATDIADGSSKTYTLRVIGDNGCVATNDVTVSRNLTLPTVSINTPASNTITCTTQQITLSTTGSCSGDCTYTWTPSGSGTSITVSQSDFGTDVTSLTYSVTVTDNTTGCTSLQSNEVTITKNITSPGITINGGDFTIYCNTTTTTLTTTVTDCTGCNYSWSIGGSTASIDIPANFAGGPVSVTITDPVNGCSGTDEITVTINKEGPDVTLTADPEEFTCGVDEITLSVEAGYSYVWKKIVEDDDDITLEGTGNEITISEAGTYTVTVTDGTTGCSVDKSITIADNTITLEVEITPDEDLVITCNEGETEIELTAAFDCEGCDIAWFINDEPVAEDRDGETTITITADDFGTGDELEVSVTITDADGCEGTATVTIAKDTEVEYELDPELDWDNLVLGCTESITLKVKEVCEECTYEWFFGDESKGTGELSVDMDWFDTTVDPVEPVTITLVVTNPANGCEETKEIEITADFDAPDTAKFRLISDINPITCDDDTATLTVSGRVIDGDAVKCEGCTYVWKKISDDGEDVTLTGDGAGIEVTAGGTYTVTIIGANGCESEPLSIKLNEDLKDAEIDSISPSSPTIGCDENSVEITAYPTDGEYEWILGSEEHGLKYSGSPITVSADDIAEYGTSLSVKLTGDNGCDGSKDITITKTQGWGDVSITASPGTEMNCDTSMIVLTATVDGVEDNSTYIFNWSIVEGANLPEASGVGKNTLTLLKADITGETKYKVRVPNPGSDEALCDATAIITITINEDPPTNFSITTSITEIDCNTASIELVVDTVGCVNCNSFVWKKVVAGGDDIILDGDDIRITVYDEGDYVVVVTGANNCSATSEPVTITKDSTAVGITFDQGEYELYCLPDAEVNIIATATGTGPFTFIWNGEAPVTGVDASDTYIATAPGTVTLTVTGANGCFIDTSTVVMQTLPSAKITALNGDTLDCITPSTTLSVTGCSDCDYAWTKGTEAFGGNSTSVPVSKTDIPAGTSAIFTVVVTNRETGCDSTHSITIYNNDNSGTVDLGLYHDFYCFDDADGLTLTAPNINGANYQWAINGTSFLAGLGEYTITIFEADLTNQFTNTVTLTITDNSTGCIMTGQTSILRHTTRPPATITVTGGNTIACDNEITISVDCYSSYAIGKPDPDPEYYCEYEWEMSTDGGATWVTLAETGNALSVNINTFTGNSASFRVTTTDNYNGCSTQSITTDITKGTIPTITIDLGGPYQLPCNPAEVLITATVGGNGQTPYSYSWNDGASIVGQDTYTATSTGTVTLTVTDFNSCTAYAEVEVTQASDPTASISGGADLTCTLVTTAGGLALTANTNCTVGCSYTWTVTGGTFTGTGSSITVTDIAGTSATVDLTVTDGNGCTGNATQITIYDRTAGPDATISPAGPLTITCSTNPTGVELSVPTCTGCTFAWVKGSDAFGTNVNPITVSPSDIYEGGSANFSVTVTDQYGCSATATTSVTISRDTEQPTVTLSPANLVIHCNSTDDQRTLTATATSCTGCNYTWKINGTTQSESTNQFIVPSTIANGDIVRVIVTSAGGCKDSAQVAITRIANPTATIVASPGTELNCDTTSILLSATTSTCNAPTCTYQWWGDAIGTGTDLGSGNTIPVTTPGTYFLVVTDGNGCTGNTSVTITQNVANPTVSINQTSATINCLTPNRTVRLTTTTDCTTGCSYTWKKDGTPILAYTSSYLDVSESDISEGGYADYTVTVTSANGCSSTETAPARISRNTQQPTVSLDNTTPFIGCLNQNGTITLNATVGNCTNCSYTWSPTPTNASPTTSATYNATGLADGSTITILVTSNSGCYASADAVVTKNTTPPTATITPDGGSIDCDNPTLVLSSAVACPTAAGCTYSWATTNLTVSGSTTGSTLTVTGAATGYTSGTATLTITRNDNNCSATSASVTVTADKTIPDATITAPYTEINCNQKTITISIPACPSCTYAWTVGGATFTGTGAGTNAITLDTTSFTGNSATVSVTVTNTANNCYATSNIGVTKGLFAPTLTINPEEPEDLHCHEWSGIFVTATAAGGTGNYTFQWIPPYGLPITAPNVNPNRRILIDPGKYYITLDDGGACGLVMDSITITGSHNPVIDFDISMDTPEINICNNINTDGVTISVGIEDISYYSYVWTVTDGTFSGQGTHSITITDITGGAAVVTLTITNTVTHCDSTASITITKITGIIPPNVVSNQEFCEGATVADLNAQGNGVQWYYNGALTNSGDQLVDGGFYYATQTVGTCESEVSSTVIVTLVDPAELAPPAVEDQTLCDGATVADIITNGSNGILFFTSADLPVLPNAPLTSGAYYAIYSYGNGACQSTERTPFTITIGTPDAPEIDDQEFCPGATIANIVVPNGNIVWYFNEDDVAPLSPETFLRDGHTYWAAQSGGACGQPRTAVTINLQDGAEKPVVLGPFNFCTNNNLTVGNFTTIGYGVVWYDLNNVAVPLTTTLGKGTHVFYVEQQGSSLCAGPARTEVIINIGAPIAPTLETDQSFCDAATLTIADLYPDYTYLNWYDAAGNPLLATDPLDDGIYYATQTVGECESADKTAVLVSFLPEAELPAPILGNVALCADANTVADLKALYPNVEIYESRTATSPMALTSTLIEGTTYYVAGTFAGNCESAERRPFTVTIYDGAIPPLNLTAEFMCEDVTFYGNVKAKYPSYYTWYWNAAGTNPITNNFIFKPEPTTLYFKQNLGGTCTEDILSSLTINTANNAPADAPTAESPRYFCETKLVGQLNIEGYNVIVYTDAALQNPVSLDTPIPDGTHTYYAVQYGLGDCESNVLEILVSTGYPIAPTLETDLSFCIDATLTVADLLPQYDYLIWYYGGSPAAADDVVVAGVYYASQIIGNCESVDKTAVLVSFLPEEQIQAPFLGNIALCTGATVADIKALYPNVEIYNAAGNPVTGTLTAGTYYASSVTPDDCESTARNPFTVTLTGTIPALDLAQNMCEGATFFGNVKAKYPSIYTWYSDAAGTIEITGNFIFNTGITTLYFKQNVASCAETTLSTLTIEIDGATIDAPIAESPRTFCEGTILFGQLNIEGYNVTLYSDAALTIPVPLTDPIPFGEHTYYAVQAGSGDCESTDPLEIVIIVGVEPIPPTVEQYQLFCDKATIADLNARGANVKWYATEDATTPLDPTMLLEDGGIYFATQSTSPTGCESVLRSTVYVSIVDPSELPPPVIGNQNFCTGTTPPITIANIVTDGSNGIVFFNSSGAELLPGDEVTAGTYTAAYRYGTGTNTCQSEPSAPFTVSYGTSINTPEIDDVLLCEGATVANLPAPVGGLIWYRDESPYTPLPLNTPLSTGSYGYLLNIPRGTCTDGNSPVIFVTIGSDDIPSPTGKDNYTFCMPTVLGKLSVNGYGVKWFDAPTGGTELPLTTIVPVGENTYYAEQQGTSVCKSAGRLKVTVTVPQLLLESIYVDQDPTCSGSNGSIQIAVTGGTGSYEYTVYRNNTLLTTTSTVPITGLSAGAYKVNIEDLGTDCPSSVSTDIVLRNTNSTLFLKVTATDAPSCSGTGALELEIFGGKAPYTYTLNGTPYGTVPASGIISNVAVGTYVVGVTDAEGCLAASRTVRIAAPAAGIVVTPVTITGTNCHEATGLVDISITSPLEYFYQLNNEAIAGPFASGTDIVSFIGLPAGEHNFRVFNRCGEETIRFEVVNSGPTGTTSVLSFTATPQNLQQNGLIVELGYIALDITGGTSPYEYSLNGGSSWFALAGTVDTIRNLTEGVYNVMLRAHGVPPCQYGQFLIRVERDIIPDLLDCKEVIDREAVEDIIITGNGEIPACIYTHEGTDWDVVARYDFIVLDSVQYFMDGKLISGGVDGTLDGAVFPIGVSEVKVIVFVGDRMDSCEFTVTVTRRCPETVIDREGNSYQVTPLAGLCWSENFKATLYDDGSEIAWKKPYTSTHYSDEEATKIFGLLYTWYSAVGVPEGSTELPVPDIYGNIQGICPDGWHVPSQAEWDRLTAFPSSDLKSKEYWIVPGTNATEFDARPAGWYNAALERFEDLFGFTGWWASDSAPDKSTASHFYINYYCDTPEQKERFKGNALSVRCVLDEYCK